MRERSPLALTMRVPRHATIAQRACQWAEAKLEFMAASARLADTCMYRETNPHKGFA